MASQKYENEEFGEKRKSVDRNEKSELEQQQQPQIVSSSSVIHDYEMIDIPGVGNNSTASTPASSTTTVTSSTSSITPTSSCSSTTSSNLRDLENLVKQQQPSGTGKTVPSSSNVVNNPNTISPTTANSTTNSSSDLRRTQHEIEDPDYVSVPRLCPGVNCPEKIVS